jgi:hypothetical protein
VHGYTSTVSQSVEYHHVTASQLLHEMREGVWATREVVVQVLVFWAAAGAGSMVN